MSSKLEDLSKLLDSMQEILNQAQGRSFKIALVFIPMFGPRPTKSQLMQMLSDQGFHATEILVTFHRSPEGRDDIILVSTPESDIDLAGWKWYRSAGLDKPLGYLYRFSADLNQTFGAWRESAPTDLKSAGGRPLRADQHALNAINTQRAQDYVQSLLI